MYQTLTEHLRRQALAQPERTAIINVVGDTVQKFSYGQLYQQALQAGRLAPAARVRARGPGPDHHGKPARSGP